MFCPFFQKLAPFLPVGPRSWSLVGSSAFQLCLSKQLHYPGGLYFYQGRLTEREHLTPIRAQISRSLPPNMGVKRVSSDNTRGVTLREDSPLPGIFEERREIVAPLFFCPNAPFDGADTTFNSEGPVGENHNKDLFGRLGAMAGKLALPNRKGEEPMPDPIEESLPVEAPVSTSAVSDDRERERAESKKFHQGLCSGLCRSLHGLPDPDRGTGLLAESYRRVPG